MIRLAREQNIIGFSRDTLLMMKAAQGDRAAYGKIYMKYLPIVIAYLNRYSLSGGASEEVAQEVFARVWEQRQRYHPRSAPKTFFIGVAKNIVREDRAKSQCSDTKRLMVASQYIPSEPSPDMFSEHREMLSSVKKKIECLPKKQRQTLEFIYIRETSVSDTAKAMQCSIEAVHTRLSRARQQIRRSLKCAEYGASTREACLVV